MHPPGQRKENLNSGLGLTTAQRSNLAPLTARGYAAWRARSVTLLAGEPFALAREAALFRLVCAPQSGESWLDAGTSAGFYAGVLAGAGAQVYALDLSPAMLAEARRRHPRADITWVQGNVEDGHLPDAAFDGITVGATVNETHDPARFLGELERALRPGGQLWLMYLRRTGGPLQRALARPPLGGLTFPDPAWVAAQLPTCTRVHAVTAGAVRFERYVRDRVTSL